MNKNKLYDFLAVELTNKCNNKCIFCYNPPSQNRITSDNSSINQIKKHIIDFRANGTKSIQFTGGEPTLSSHLPDLINFAKTSGYENISLLTNGRRLAYKKYLENLIQLGLTTIIISVPTFQNKLYCLLTNTDNAALQQVKTAIKNIKKFNSIELGFSFVLTSANIKSMCQSVNFALKWKPEFITLNCMLPHFKSTRIDNKKVYENLKPSFELIRSTIKSLVDEYSKKTKICLEGFPVCIIKNFRNCIINESSKCNFSIIDESGRIVKGKNSFETLDFNIYDCFFCKNSKYCRYSFLKDKAEFSFNSLSPHRVAIDIQDGACDYDCIFCSRLIENTRYHYLNKDQERARVDFSLLKNFLSAASQVSDSLDIWGRDRIDRYENILRVIKVAKESGFKNIRLWNTPIKATDRKHIDSLINCGVSGFEVPIYGLTNEVHKKITRSNTFHSLLEGLKILNSEKRLRNRAHIVMIKQNLKEVPAMVKYFNSEFNSFNLSLWFFYPDSIHTNAGINTYKTCLPKFSELIETFKNYSFGSSYRYDPIETLFIPLCITNKLRNYYPTLKAYDWGPTRLLTFDKYGGYLRFLSGKNEFNPIHTDKCKKCVGVNICPGLFRSYYEIWGDKELAPMRTLYGI